MLSISSKKLKEEEFLDQEEKSLLMVLEEEDRIYNINKDMEDTEEDREEYRMQVKEGAGNRIQNLSK